MSEKRQHSAPELENEPPGLENEFVWAVRPFFRRCMIILSCWTTPSLDTPTFTGNDGVSARAFALFLIAALAFAVRGETGGDNRTDVFTAFAGGIAVILSAALNLLSHTCRISERLVISAYASTIVVMFFFVIFQQLLTLSADSLFDLFWNTGDVVVPAALAGIAAFVLLVAKSALWDKKHVGLKGLRHGLALTIGSTVIVIIIALLSSRIFNELVKWLGKASPSGG